MNPFEMLLTSPQGQKVSPELLEMLGNKASAMFRSGTPLNAAVVQLVADHPEFNNEHIKRVIEFANNITFQHLFQNSEDKNVHFEVADPGVILRDIRDGGSPAHDGKVMSSKGNSDYSSPPSANLEKDEFGDPESGLAQVFENNQRDGTKGQGDPIEKAASVRDDHTVHANPIDDVHELHTKLQAARAEAVQAYESFDQLEKQAQADLYRAVKHEVLDPDGAGLGGVIGALRKVASDPQIFTVLGPMAQQLALTVGGGHVEASLEKRAGKVVNYAHPVVRAWGGLTKVAEEKRRCELGIAEIDRGLEQTSAFLKTALMGLVNAGMGVMGGVSSVKKGVQVGKKTVNELDPRNVAYRALDEGNR